MKSSSLMIFFFLIASQVVGQFFHSRNQGINLFEIGTKLIEIGDYKGADSVLTLAMCTYKNENVFYNRAAARLYQYDTIGFCDDISIAAHKYFDLGADRLFNDICCSSVDSNFYDNHNNLVKGSKFQYYEVIRKHKYTGETIGIYHTKSTSREILNIDYGCENIIGLEVKKTDIIAIYKLVDNEKNFYLATKGISINNDLEYQDLKRIAQTVLRAKYNSIKFDNNIDEVNVYVEITFSKEGKIIHSQYLGTYPELVIGDIKNDLQKDLEIIISKYPKVKPAQFHGEKVNFITYDSFTY